MINGFVTKKNLLKFFLIVVILSRKKSKSALRSENVPKKLCTAATKIKLLLMLSIA